MFGTILYFVAVGLLAGFVARFVVRFLIRGRNDLGLLQTLALGIAGSFVGGLLGYLLFGDDAADGALQTAGVLGSILGAILALFVYRALTQKKLKLRRHRILRHKAKHL